jgi:DNA-binding HxlR family transcriptional regulator
VRSGCPISLSLEILGDRWSLLVLRDIMFAGKRTFNQFVASDEAIATNILQDRLTSLVSAGLLTRAPDPTHSQRVIYSLTEQSITLVPTLVHIGSWGRQWLQPSPLEAAANAELVAGGPVAWDALMDDLRAEHLPRSTQQSPR